MLTNARFSLLNIILVSLTFLYGIQNHALAERWDGMVRPPEKHQPSIDSVSAATPPPALFVEILNLSKGDAVPAGSTLQAFGGPQWAIPSLHFLIDGQLVKTAEEYSASFEINRETSLGSHHFRVEFVCDVDACDGEQAFADITLVIEAPTRTGSDAGPSSTDSGPGQNERGRDAGSSPTVTYGGGACNSSSSNSGGIALLVLLVCFLGPHRKSAGYP